MSHSRSHIDSLSRSCCRISLSFSPSMVRYRAVSSANRHTLEVHVILSGKSLIYTEQKKKVNTYFIEVISPKILIL